MYDVGTIERAVKDRLLGAGVEVWLQARVAGLDQASGSVRSVSLENAQRIEGDVFVDATGSFGPQSFCTEHGNGCVMCVMRCPTFGPRVSVVGLAGITERQGRKPDGTVGAMSGACELPKDSIAPELVRQLEEHGVLVLPLPPALVDEKKLDAKCCQQYAMAEYAQNVVLLHNGRVKLMTTHVPLQQLRQVRGLENVRYADPYAGTVGNSMRYNALAPRDDAMQVQGGVDNLFCGGEKAGLLVGHTEAMVTGTLGGHNVVVEGRPPHLARRAAVRRAPGRQCRPTPQRAASAPARRPARRVRRTARAAGCVAGGGIGQAAPGQREVDLLRAAAAPASRRPARSSGRRPHRSARPSLARWPCSSAAAYQRGKASITSVTCATAAAPRRRRRRRPSAAAASRPARQVPARDAGWLP
jgi:hypothetical protein